MPRPTDIERIQYLTIQDVTKSLDLSRQQVNRRISSGVFRPPIYVNGSGVRFFNAYWLKHALLAVACEQRHISPAELKQELANLEKENGSSEPTQTDQRRDAGANDNGDSEGAGVPAPSLTY